MFSRVSFEDMTSTLVVVAFFLFAILFGLIIWRALRMSPQQREHIANLPLQDNPPATDAETSDK